MRLSIRLFLSFLGLLVFILGGLVTAVYITDTEQIHSQVARDEQAILQNLVNITQQAWLGNDQSLLVRYTYLLPQWYPALLSAAVMDPAGRTLANSELNRIGRVQSESAMASGYSLSQPVRVGQNRIATVTVIFSQAKIDAALAREMSRLKKRMAILAACYASLGLFLTALLARSIVRPLERFTLEARRIGAGEREVDLGAFGRRSDEIGILARQMETMTTDLKALDEKKEDFVSSVTHELRSPLGAIDNLIRSIVHDRRRGASIALDDFLERMLKNTQRLRRFIDDLLDVAALERGKVRVAMQTVDLKPLVEDVVRLFEPTLRERRLRCDFRPSESGVQVAADPDKLRQILTNLLSNAIKYTPDQGAIQITSDVVATGDIRIIITDSGIGIAPQDQVRIFRRFEQVRAARMETKGPKGTGLGLAICRDLVELMEGEIGVQSDIGQGSTFWFTLRPAKASVMAVTV